MKRNAINNLIKWKHDEERKPMVLKGARQVGKTFLIRSCLDKNNSDFLEINFIKNPEIIE